MDAVEQIFFVVRNQFPAVDKRETDLSSYLRKCSVKPLTVAGALFGIEKCGIYRRDDVKSAVGEGILERFQIFRKIRPVLFVPAFFRGRLFRRQL